VAGRRTAIPDRVNLTLRVFAVGAWRHRSGPPRAGGGPGRAGRGRAGRRRHRRRRGDRPAARDRHDPAALGRQPRVLQPAPAPVPCASRFATTAAVAPASLAAPAWSASRTASRRSAARSPSVARLARAVSCAPNFRSPTPALLPGQTRGRGSRGTNMLRRIQKRAGWRRTGHHATGTRHRVSPSGGTGLRDVLAAPLTSVRPGSTPDAPFPIPLVRTWMRLLFQRDGQTDVLPPPGSQRCCAFASSCCARGGRRRAGRKYASRTGSSPPCRPGRSASGVLDCAHPAGR
jgi:hypothetical protein